MTKKQFSIILLFVLILISGCQQNITGSVIAPVEEIPNETIEPPPKPITSPQTILPITTPEVIENSTAVISEVMDEPSQQPKQTTPPQTKLPKTTSEKIIVVVSKVIDGDTIKLSNGETVRLLGINTLEIGQPYYEESTSRLKELIENKEVILEKDVEDKDQYGRFLRYVFLDDENINVKLVREGLATVYIIPPNTKYEVELENAWQECLNNEVNLCKPPSKKDICDNTCIGISYFRWNAEGNDCYNLNDEYVTFKNSCDYSCDLTGWTVKDESSRNPYVFPTFVLDSEATVTLFTGCGTNAKTELYWCSSGYPCNAIWNNNGDTLYLRNLNGELVLSYPYSGY